MSELQQKIDAVNHANEVLTETLLRLQKAFGLQPDPPSYSPAVNDLMNAIFGKDGLGWTD